MILTSGNEQLIVELYPSFAALNVSQRNLVLGGLAGGINPGRIFQLEGTPGEFAQVTRHGAINFDPAMYAVFHILDLGSIRGNAYVVEGSPLLNAAGKRVDAFWNDFTIGFMPPILDLAGQVASGKITPVQAYTAVIDMRAKQFNLNPATDDGRAVVRLCAMMTTRFPKVTEIEAKEMLTFLGDNVGSEKEWKNAFVRELNMTGYDGTPSICLGYAPVAAKIANGMMDQPDVSFIDMFAVFAKSLNNCFTASRAAISSYPMLKQVKGQITVELEKLHPQLVNGNHAALSNSCPV